MSSRRDDLDLLRRLAPTNRALAVFDADTQETSYGTLVVDGTPVISDTHRKERWYVSTVEVLTEVARTVRISRHEVESFARLASRHGLQALPYSTCFFKSNLHVYAYYGPLRGLDLATVGRAVPEAEQRLDIRLRAVWEKISDAILRAQRDLLAGRRKARYEADLEVLRRRSREARQAFQSESGPEA